MRLPLLFALAAAVAVTGCATYKDLQPAQSTRAEVEAALGQPAEVRARNDGETWLYYPQQPYGRKVRVARVTPDGKLIAVEQRLSEEYIAKLIPNQSTRTTCSRSSAGPTSGSTFRAWSATCGPGTCASTPRSPPP